MPSIEEEEEGGDGDGCGGANDRREEGSVVVVDDGREPDTTGRYGKALMAFFCPTCSEANPQETTSFSTSLAGLSGSRRRALHRRVEGEVSGERSPSPVGRLLPRGVVTSPLVSGKRFACFFPVHSMESGREEEEEEDGVSRLDVGGASLAILRRASRMEESEETVLSNTTSRSGVSLGDRRDFFSTTGFVFSSFSS